ncbi:galactose-3-O-sulfotransferase 4-like [Centruroides sculpturatus]|uniref:galactose-3-O-sulfotransferase 4-like n=1 Tax=Centruroides sculpturatus TaxID=218467 RepID=UPI000C6DCB7A|nr:galactose-3-O-sulfotransferase 4-like [Centruroides sculpturatus]XP_023222370.1 galactose-3-O-sulfotransferase 4-like [Centruroides sculpturatus]XP_023222371.1 galactose-3-O-sulfotransferase 4-like [Centruroides sculpturatus]XP_023222372.1 galactose-3-O-sulfotransferase 4-like [Centruroides sculpturatus]
MFIRNCRYFYRNPSVLATLGIMSVVLLLFNIQTPFSAVPGNLQRVRRGESATCSSKTNIVFLKTHKCASSTIQNIFMRYGDRNNLTFVLPAAGNYLGNPAPFRRTMVPDPSKFNVIYNILTLHSRFNYKEMKALMPNDTVFVTILRNPVDLYESLYSYLNLDRVYKMNLSEAVNKLSYNTLSKRINDKIGLNQMVFDLGFEYSKHANSSQIESFIERIDSLFDLVMITEKMDESLILLRHLMCWSLDDVLAFRVNARSRKSVVTDKTREKLRRLNWMDQLLYDHFLKRFEDRVKRFGYSSLQNEVILLNQKRSIWYDYCVKETRSYSDGVRAKVVTYIRNQNFNDSCASLTRSELDYIDYLRKKQKHLFRKTKP